MFNDIKHNYIFFNIFTIPQFKKILFLSQYRHSLRTQTLSRLLWIHTRRADPQRPLLFCYLYSLIPAARSSFTRSWWRRWDTIIYDQTRDSIWRARFGQTRPPGRKRWWTISQLRIKRHARTGILIVGDMPVDRCRMLFTKRW